jgi:hypothetical protein
LRNTPSRDDSTSTTSPGLSQRGGSKRAPAPVGVPVAIMSPGFSVAKVADAPELLRGRHRGQQCQLPGLVIRCCAHGGPLRRRKSVTGDQRLQIGKVASDPL